MAVCGMADQIDTELDYRQTLTSVYKNRYSNNMINGSVKTQFPLQYV